MKAEPLRHTIVSLCITQCLTDHVPAADMACSPWVCVELANALRFTLSDSICRKLSEGVLQPPLQPLSARLTGITNDL